MDNEVQSIKICTSHLVYIEKSAIVLRMLSVVCRLWFVQQLFCSGYLYGGYVYSMAVCGRQLYGNIMYYVLYFITYVAENA